MQKQNTVNIRDKFAGTPSLQKFVTTHFEGENVALQNTLFDAVDTSAFSLHEWVESLTAMEQWLEQNNLILSIKSSIEYVSCAAAAVETSANQSHLPSVVKDFLDQYGCESAVKK